MPRYDIPVWKMCEEAAKLLPESFAPIDIIRKVHEKYPHVNSMTIRCQVIASSPNHPSSKYYSTSHKTFYYLGSGRFRFLKPDDNLIEKATTSHETVDRIKTNEKIEKRIKSLTENLDSLLSNFEYREGPDLYFYRRLIAEHKAKKLPELLESNYFIELMYATLVSWDMNTRGAKMEYFDKFEEEIMKNKGEILELAEKRIERLSESEFGQLLTKLSSIYDNLHLMKTSSRLVSNSKVLHFLLPNLVVPMDRKNTLEFFYGNTSESRNKFRDIMVYAYRISKNPLFNKYFDEKWHTTIPKMIDNAIIGSMKKKNMASR